MDYDLIKEIIIAGIGASVFSTATIQKIKEMLKSKSWLYFITIIVSFGLGVAFSLSFTHLDIVNSLWVGLCTWVGAGAIYKTFEKKLFIPFSEMNNKNDVIIDRDDINEI